MKKIAILYSEYTPTIDAIKYQLPDYDIDCISTPKDMEQYDLVIILNYNGEYDGNAIKCHYSLLPAFDTKEPVKDAVLEGVKVTGITIFFTKPKKIIAQYPLFISNTKHFDEIQQELKYLEQTLLPLVVEKVLKSEIFDIQKMLNKSCNHNCGGCNGCSH